MNAEHIELLRYWLAAYDEAEPNFSAERAALTAALLALTPKAGGGELWERLDSFVTEMEACDRRYGETVRTYTRKLRHLLTDTTRPPADAPAAGRVDETVALAEFTEYFVKNYPGPHTVISDPNWHAPKIFRAAQYALKQAALGTAAPAGDGCVLVPDGWMRDRAQVIGLAEHLENTGWAQDGHGDMQCLDQGAAMAADVVRRVLLPLIAAPPAGSNGDTP